LGVGIKGSFICYIESFKPFFVLSQNISCNPAKQKKSYKLQDSDEEEHSKREPEKATVGHEEDSGFQEFRNSGFR
jgi:hypothetical protein